MKGLVENQNLLLEVENQNLQLEVKNPHLKEIINPIDRYSQNHPIKVEELLPKKEIFLHLMREKIRKVKKNVKEVENI